MNELNFELDTYIGDDHQSQLHDVVGSYQYDPLTMMIEAETCHFIIADDDTPQYVSMSDYTK